MPGPRVKGKRSSAVQLRAAHVRPLQSGSLLAVRLKTTGGYGIRPYGTTVGGGVPDAPQAAARSKSITSHYILYSFAEFCYNGSIPFIIGHFEGVIL